MATTAEARDSKQPNRNQSGHRLQEQPERIIKTPIGILAMRFVDGNGPQDDNDDRIQNMSIHISCIYCIDLLPEFFELAERCGVNFPEGFGNTLGTDIHGSMYLASGTRRQLEAFILGLEEWRKAKINRKRIHGCRLYDLRTIARDERGIMRRHTSILARYGIGMINFGFRAGIPPWEEVETGSAESQTKKAIATIHLRIEVPKGKESELPRIIDEILESDRSHTWDIRCERCPNSELVGSGIPRDVIPITQ